MRGKTADDIFSFENRCFGDFSINPFSTLFSSRSIEWKSVQPLYGSSCRIVHFPSVIPHFFSQKQKNCCLQINRKAAISPSSKFAFRDAPKTFSNSLTGNAIWKCFWPVFTRTRASKNSTLQSFFPRNQTFSNFEVSFGKVTSTNDLYHSPIFHTTESSQSLSKWFKQREKRTSKL